MSSGSPEIGGYAPEGGTSPVVVSECLSRLVLVQADAHISDRAITPIVVTLVTSESQRTTLTETEDATGLARGTVHGGLKALVETGLATKTVEPRTTRMPGGKSPSIFSPTKALHAAAMEKLDWKNAIELHRIAQTKGISEQEALSLVLAKYHQPTAPA